ncbi:GAF domain-containing protein [Xanthocytophaga flava]|uniref:GAF domain-containing protein n=1 Tax=Xanthocytophaga flava TaxID=3048013 RepID=UPI0028D632F5|nr:GAF domain-containing protein [Xanthocytophaga flavus]MDJ1468384.1 GAF domain-containing protein [Xanthocytophaga flavus]
MSRIQQFIERNLILLGISLTVLLMIVSSALSWYNKQEMLRTTAIKLQAEELRKRIDDIFTQHITKMDLGLRGYGLTQNEQMLIPYTSSIQMNKGTMAKVDSLLHVQNLDTSRVQFGKIREAVNAYISHCDHMRDLAKEGNTEEFLALLKLDKGYDLWKVYSPFASRHRKYVDTIIQKAQADYEAAMSRNLIVQAILLLIGLPILGLVVRKLTIDAASRKKLLSDLEENNEKYLFNPGNSDRDESYEQVVATSIQNFKEASTLVKAMSAGNFEVNWKGLTDANKALNKETLAGELLQMREQMKLVKAEDERRNWTNEGLARFSEIVRNNQNNLEKLSNEAISFLTKYLKAQQGSLFVVQGDRKDVVLEMLACYAFDRKKFIQKQISAGSGLVGQAYLEADTILLTDVPKGYMEITSGLGDATPGCLAIVPMKYNDMVEAIIELASFERFEDYQIRFLEKAGEFVASAILTVKTAEHTARLLQDSQEQAEMLKSQEEELRQNMEELAATQEEMYRKERDLEERLRMLERQ